MKSMSNRLGDEFAKSPPQADDRTRLFVAQIMLRRPKIQRFEFLPDGNIRFRLPLANTAIAGTNLAGARLLRTRWFADFIGEYLVRLNLARFDEIVDRSDYPELARQKCHTGFGLWICPTYLQFQFHCELLNSLFNEGLKQDLRQVSA